MQLSNFLKNASIAMALGASWASVRSPAQTSTSLSGQVQTEDGKPVEGALMVARPKISKTSGMSASISGKTAADGTFVLSGLTPGQYQICAHDQRAGLLDPCQWSTSPPTATITATGTANVPAITLKKGRRLEVHILDEAGLMATDGAKPRLLVGLWRDNGLFVTIPLKTQDTRGRVHAQFVPEDKPIQISVTSDQYVLKDSNGAVMDAKSGIAKQAEIPPGNQPIILTFQVAGHAK
jgi:hypothetical protein